MSLERVAICVIAYNEKQNIEALLKQILSDSFMHLKVFVYTDGSTDGTANIVDKLTDTSRGRIVHSKGKKRKGKQYGYNRLLKLVKNYKFTVFMDGDVSLERNSLKYLVTFIQQHPQYKVVGAFLHPITISNSRIPMIYQKAKEHIYKNGVYKYFTGRAFVAVTKYLPKIPKNSRSDDFYLNLRYDPSEIGICRDSVVCYVMPHTTKGIFWYSYYIGGTLTDVRDNYKKLWEEQIKRIPLWDYVVFGLTQKNFGLFWSELGNIDKIIFVYSRIITILGFVSGYINSSRKFLWEPIKETKSMFAD